MACWPDRPGTRMRPPTSSHPTSRRTTRFSKRSDARCLPEVRSIDVQENIHGPGRRTGGPRLMSALMIASILIGVANVGLASSLLVVYRGVYARTKAPFTLALLLFASAFLAQNALVVYSFFTMMAIVPSALDPYLLGIRDFEGLGLGAMLWSAAR